MPAEMIAMLDGLGAYGKNPVGDVDPRLLPSRMMTAGHASMAGPVPTGNIRRYALGAAEDEETPPAGSSVDTAITLPKVLMWAGAAVLAVWGYQAITSGGGAPAPAVNGYPEPEMVHLPAPKRRRRRKARKE